MMWRLKALLQAINLRVGAVSCLFSANPLDHCGCCHTTWMFVRPHLTYFSKDDYCHPLCEKCWIELDQPRDRLQYYLIHWRVLRDSGMTSDLDWAMMSEAVLRGN